MPSSLGPGADIWLHAVSAGESIAAAPLVEALLAQGHTLVLSTTTPTGRAQLMRQFSGRAVICYGPFDAPRCIKRFLNQVRPKLALMIETEIWPNWTTACASRGIPVALLNGRLSERSFQWVSKARIDDGGYPASVQLDCGAVDCPREPVRGPRCHSGSIVGHGVDQGRSGAPGGLHRTSYA